VTTGDSIAYWPGETTNTLPAGFPGFGIAYPTAKVNDPANGNVASWKAPQAAPTLGPTGTCDPLTASGGHPGVVMVGMGDGSVRGIPSTISLRAWNAILTPRGGETGTDL
jgi:hypothetical protein